MQVAVSAWTRVCEADDSMVVTVVGVSCRRVCARKCIEHGSSEDTGCSCTTNRSI